MEDTTEYRIPPSYLLQYMDSVLSIYMLKVKNRCVFQNYLFGKVVIIDQFNPIMPSIHKMVNRTLKLLQHNFVETILNTFNVCLTIFFFFFFWILAIPGLKYSWTSEKHPSIDAFIKRCSENIGLLTRQYYRFVVHIREQINYIKLTIGP